MGTRDVADFLTLGLRADQLKLIRDVGWRAVVTFHMAYACGFLLTVGLPFSGFAHADEVKGIAAEIREDRIERLELAIFDTRRSQCKANTVEAKGNYAERLTDLQVKYRRLTGSYPRIPACDEV